MSILEQHYVPEKMNASAYILRTYNIHIQKYMCHLFIWDVLPLTEKKIK